MENYYQYYHHYPQVRFDSCGNPIGFCECPNCNSSPQDIPCGETDPCNGETYDTACTFYNGEDLCCPSSTLHPLLSELSCLVKSTDPKSRKSLESILIKINQILCYTLSKDFIKQMFVIIKNDPELLEQFCELACSCECMPTPPDLECELVCQPITSLGYDSDSVNKLTVNHPTVVGATKYIYTMYEQVGTSDTYNQFSQKVVTTPTTGNTQSHDIITLDQIHINLHNYYITYQAINENIPNCFVGFAPQNSITFATDALTPCGAKLFLKSQPVCDLSCSNSSEFYITRTGSLGSYGATINISPKTSQLGTVSTSVLWYEKINGTWTQIGTNNNHTGSTPYTITATGLNVNGFNDIVVVLVSEIPGADPQCRFSLQGQISSVDFNQVTSNSSGIYCNIRYIPAITCTTADSLSYAWAGDTGVKVTYGFSSTGAHDNLKLYGRQKNTSTWLLLNILTNRSGTEFISASGNALNPKPGFEYEFKIEVTCGGTITSIKTA